ncbi:peptidase M61 [Pedobacter yulinensis]|uniref:Peptidase M61 n=1 Tax=Pedobacter yulinensis TaxID=2126353 RepID=A0A2T3HS39_9SPHI|nr:PDZ domain-containing protein [Pedobacter yulinensis]PST85226.1 peptidase M61 [Pedobacter yulinensis]
MKKLYLFAGLCLCAFTVKSQREIAYTVSFPNAVHHEAHIEMEIDGIKPGNVLLRMARSSPGRYATHEFGKNIYQLKIWNNGKAVSFEQPAGDQYLVKAAAGKLRVSYTLFGNWIDGTYAGIDETHAHLNIPASFLYPAGMDKVTRKVTFRMPQGANWKPATQLKPVAPGVFTAPGLQYFMDSPVELADYRAALVAERLTNGKKQRIWYTGHIPDEQAVADRFAKMIARVVDEQAAIWGELPVFDYGQYYFLHDVHPENAGDGMEHRNSTVITQPRKTLNGNENQLLGTFSHEFFHAWNVERLRPKSLEPFDFSHSNVSGELWLAEGFTQYYGNLVLKRAGFRSGEECLRTFSGIVNAVLTSPGAKDFSPVQASRYAVFADAGVAVDQTNMGNIFTSYYTYGAAVALALDLELRGSHNLTLDDYMRALWTSHGKPELPYTLNDLELALARLTKNQAFARKFFADHVNGTAKPDFAALFARAGLVLRKPAKPGIYTGLENLQVSNGEARIKISTVKGSPAYEAGLDAGDVILSIGQQKINDAKDLGKAFEDRQAGEPVVISYTHRGQEKQTTLKITESPYLELVTLETTGQQPGAAMRTFRDKWLETQIKPN